MSGEHLRPIGNLLYLNLPKGVEMVQRSLDSSFSSNVQYCIEISILVKNLYPVRFLRISWIIGRGYCWRLTTLSNSLRSLTQWTLSSFWGMIKVGEEHSLAPCGCKAPISQSHMWLSGWMVLKVANGPGFEPSAKGRVSSMGLSLSFAFVCTLGAASVWGSSCIASIFLIPPFSQYETIAKWWKFVVHKGQSIFPCSPGIWSQAVPHRGEDLPALLHLNLWMWEPVDAKLPCL
jgi:hypothetical protein